MADIYAAGAAHESIHNFLANHPVRLVLCWCPAGCSWLVLRSRRSSQQQPSSRSSRAAEQGLLMQFFFNRW
jgi:hypothetical protein